MGLCTKMFTKFQNKSPTPWHATCTCKQGGSIQPVQVEDSPKLSLRYIETKRHQRFQMKPWCYTPLIIHQTQLFILHRPGPSPGLQILAAYSTCWSRLWQHLTVLRKLLLYGDYDLYCPGLLNKEQTQIVVHNSLYFSLSETCTFYNIWCLNEASLSL